MKNSKITIREMSRSAIFAAITGILAFVIIPLPFSPVPVSGQTLGVMLAGVYLLPRNAVMSQVIYILLGLIGVPVFAGGSSGPGVLLGPTGGFIWGFLLSAYFISKFTTQGSGKKFKRDLLVLITGGILMIYIPGVIQLILITQITPVQALTTAVLPFLPGDILKILAVILIKNRLSLPD